MGEWWSEALPWLTARGALIAPLLITLWMAWGDILTHRIPNYLTFGTAATGLAYQFWAGGLNGLGDGFLGLLLGFGLLILPYAMGGMGAGDVKALAGLGAWLGVKQTFYLFLYMGLSGGVLALLVILRRGQVRQRFKAWWVALLNRLLTRGTGPAPTPEEKPAEPKVREPGFAYGVALAVGMVILFVRG